MGVAPEVLDHRVRPVEGRLRIHNPRCALQEVHREAQISWEVPARASVAECREELASEYLREGSNGKQKSPAARTKLAVGGERAAGDDAVQMDMTRERLAPGVPDGGDTDLPAEVLGIAPEGLERGGSRLKQDVVEETGADVDGSVQRVRQREDDVEVLEWKKLLAACVKPSLLCEGSALGAVAISAGVLDGALGVARVTSLQAAAERSGPACLDRLDDAALLKRSGGANGARMGPEDVAIGEQRSSGETTKSLARKSLGIVAFFAYWCTGSPRWSRPSRSRSLPRNDSLSASS
jgi:hypothetical protein